MVSGHWKWAGWLALTLGIVSGVGKLAVAELYINEIFLIHQAVAIRPRSTSNCAAPRECH